MGHCAERLALQITPTHLFSPTNTVIFSYKAIRSFTLILGKSIRIIPSQSLLHVLQSVFEEDSLQDFSRQENEDTKRGVRISRKMEIPAVQFIQTEVHLCAVDLSNLALDISYLRYLTSRSDLVTFTAKA